MIAPVFHKGVVAIKPVLDTEGHQVISSDGRRMMENDPFGQFKVNWETNTLLISGFFCWSIAGISILKKRLSGKD